MTIFDAIFLGIIEGITEFIPVSSTGHLIFLSEVLGLEQNNANKAFEIIIQFAAIMALVFVYPSKFTFKHINLWTKIFLAFIPIGIVGFIFSNQIKALFSIQIVAWMFIIGGIIFLIVEKFYDEKKSHINDVEDVSLKQAMWIGFAQIFALIPGTSRAGASIIGAMIVGLNRKASAEFSFLLAVPVMCATTFYDVLKHYEEILQTGNLLPLIIGFIVSFLVAFIVIKLFLKFLEKFTFVAFGIYRIIFGILILVLF
ncbi:undecaprenyl-diphosphate phosphatase [Aliarcobacter thereius]|uniref:Undecaprenyl-diphosphatase n=1 Tax=Aliarcobacter thereius LMG 24486 TaxID=1032240 RepID=A0A1C7WSY8_9BACT|nr:undecaprenyl-diphosphate phosphatase [Aliarcobacter thereius]OCL96473.1 Undecaprenyl-diphosphatase [Aliarcobacter thereius LMG 24486]QBF15566.1 undecaprenyl pyrophosphate phosphatase [Aliarcobacter thereius LMG 24486]TLS91661.1 undecaprenyl-diphosphate phosphatase [Aliarcobacter thereius]HJE03715.1 undecaprenyl-diphosphate phosphatase [Aliarcobacter thereius]